MSITPDDIRRKLAEVQLAQVDQLLEAEEKPIEFALTNTSAGFHRGVLQAVGLPVDMMNAAAGLVGFDVEEPVGGFKSLNRLARAVGLAQPDPNTFAGRAAESVGAAAAPLGVLGAASRFGKVGGAIVESFRRAPGKFSALELSAGLGGGLGAATARELAPEQPLAEAGGEIAGGLLNPPLLATLATRAAIRRSRGVRQMFTAEGKQKAAGRALLANAENPQAVHKVIGNREFQESPLTPAQETGDRGLMTLERSAARFTAEAERRYADTVDEINAALRTQMSDVQGPAQPLQARQVLDAEVRRADELIQANIDGALAKARQKIDDLGGLDVVARTRANTIVGRQLDEAKAAGRVQEAEFWNAVDSRAVTSTQVTEADYNGLVSGRVRTADPSDIPGFVHDFLRPGADGATQLGGEAHRATVGEMQTLRSRILGEVRKEEALGKAANRQKVRLLNSLQESILDDLGQLAETGPEGVAANVARAREFSRSFNDRFSRGEIARVMGRERGGGVAVSPELTLETLVGQASPKAGPNADALMRAVGDTPELRQALTEHVTQRFFGSATDATGAVVPARAEQFLRNNAQLLDRMPDVRRQLEDATLSQRTAVGVEKAAKAERAVLHDKNRSVAALYLNASPSREINKVLEASPEPAKALRELKAAMRGDTGGEDGLRAAFMREMIGRAELSKFDATGLPGFDANRFRKEFQTAGKIGREAGILSAGDMERLDKISAMAQKSQAPQRIQPRALQELVGADIGTGLYDLLVRISAANVGAASPLGQASGASLVTAGFAVRWARRVLEQTPSVKVRNLVAEAVFDKELFELLLKKAGSPEQAVELSQQLSGWLVNLGIDRDEQ